MKLQTLKQFWKKSEQDLIFTQATALAYTTLLSLVPVLAVAFFLFHAVGGFENLEQHLKPLIERNLAPSFSDQISKHLFGFLNNVQANAIGIFGLLGFMFTSISTLATIEKTFNIIWGVQRNRTWGQKVVTYWSLLTIGPLLLALSLYLSSKALIWLQQDTGEISKVLVWSTALIPYFSSGLLFSFLYIFMPNVNVSKRDAFIAGGITGVIFELAKLIYASYATNAIANQSVYGSLAIFPVFLLWLYLIWLIILFGAEFCYYLQYHRLKIPYQFTDEEKLNPFLAMDILEALGQSQETPKGGMTTSELLRYLRISMVELTQHLDFLEDEGWINRSQPSRFHKSKFHLSVSLDKIPMNEILSSIEEFRYTPKSEKALSLYNKLLELF